MEEIINFANGDKLTEIVNNKWIKTKDTSTLKELVKSMPSEFMTCYINNECTTPN